MSSGPNPVRLTDEAPMDGGLERTEPPMNAFLTRLGNAGLTLLISVSILSFSLAAWNITTPGL
jgi:hypothetical protein